ncbi:MAG: hypothetical protein WAM58_18740 [Candidatus Acidiferrum sp.]
MPNSDVPQSAGSTPKHGQARCGLEMLTDTEGIQFPIVCEHVHDPNPEAGDNKRILSKLSTAILMNRFLLTAMAYCAT